ncbi:MORN repeat-containing protein [Acanthamoeba castellanii medusavirus]|uniref:MORN repeat-containing protein n=1 Tax=Acanthamoeba castellanii medusavirus J1 TaxID=3114988 RepID=A0A3T1CWI0_9VIRU|nr:MORN repeat-containing protein [Acanthamoeba castellanii medusavirus]BBI30187.1 MORN repeat-containing protein [Acanthamoeba castellanii medusavirus J1]
MPKRHSETGDGLGVRKLARFSHALLDFPDEVLVIILSYVDSPVDIIRASLTCQRLRDLADDEAPWRALCARLAAHHPIAGLANETRRTPRWLAFVHELWRLRPSEARMGTMISRVWHLEGRGGPSFWQAGEAPLIINGRAHFHGFAFTYDEQSKKITQQGLWWEDMFIESMDEMPERERGRVDLNRPFDPATAADGTGYAVIEGDQSQRLAFYKGEWKGGRPHGHGRMRYWDDTYGDDEYEGEWCDGREHGQGTKVYNKDRASSYTYTGHFSVGIHDDGKIESCEWLTRDRAIVRFVDGRVYDGRIDRGMLRDAHGKMTYPNGDVHTGPFSGGVLHGQGCDIVFVDGELKSYSGSCFKGRFDDACGELEFADGSILKTHWVDGEIVFDEEDLCAEITPRSCESRHQCDAHRHLQQAAGKRILEEGCDFFVVRDEEED